MSSACKAYCSKTNVVQTSMKNCNKVKTGKDDCLNHYMYRSSFNNGKVTPCLFNNKKKKCRPIKKKGIACPGFPEGCSANLVEGHSHLVTAKESVEANGDMPLPSLAQSRGFLSPRFSSSHVTLGSWFMQNESRVMKHVTAHHEADAFSEEL